MATSLAKICSIIQDILPADVVPLSHSALIQVLVSALYSDLLHLPEEKTKQVKFSDAGKSPTVSTTKLGEKKNEIINENEIALAIAECLCSIDEDNKHTDQIEEFLEQVKESLDFFDDSNSENRNSGSERVEGCEQVNEVLVSDILMTTYGKKSLKVPYF